jgi:hypothetical protein
VKSTNATLSFDAISPNASAQRLNAAAISSFDRWELRHAASKAMIGIARRTARL